MEVKFAVAKIGKYATSESGDTLEMIERPHGGLSLVLVDGQRSGKAAKAISNLVARKAIQLLGEGVRDGAAARAAHDYLYTYRSGKVSATLNIVSIDAATRTLVISRNNPAPVIVRTVEQGLYLLDEPSSVVGVQRNTKPVITEIAAAPGAMVIAFTDGINQAGSMSGANRFNPFTAVQLLLESGVQSPHELANSLLNQALEMDQGRARDDMSVMAVMVFPGQEGDRMRWLHGRLPV